MPFYDYVCRDCGRTFEIMKGMNEEVRPKCENCDSLNTMRKFNVFGRGPSSSEVLDHEGSEHAGSCSSCSSGVCSSCKH